MCLYQFLAGYVYFLIVKPYKSRHKEAYRKQGRKTTDKEKEHKMKKMARICNIIYRKNERSKRESQISEPIDKR